MYVRPQEADDLARQKAQMLDQFPSYQIYQDIASGLNFKLKGLTQLLEHVREGHIKHIATAHRDRSARFGVKLIEWIVVREGASLQFLASTGLKTEQGFTEDLVAVVHILSCRLNGKRRYAQTQPQRKNAA